ncbi:MAG TPA: hypothetical protein DCR14_02800 [Acidimicrobiaceae bacterium]|nr:hypothetical protein [Acidimicrobiaceae bacterium]
MNTPRHLAGRSHEVELVADAVLARGATLVGPAGVGKSRIASEVADAQEADGWYVVRLRATTGTAELPLGVFLGHLGPTERFLTPLFAELRQRLTEEAAGRPMLLVVDDIDLLDDSSTVLVHQLVASGDARLLSTMRSGRLPAGEVIDLWQRGEVRRIEIGVLTPEGTAQVAAALLGARLDASSAERLHDVTDGNPLFIREVLLAAEEHHAIERPDSGLLRLAQLPAAATRLVEIVETRLSHLASEDRWPLLHIAFAEPCGRAEVASVADLDTLARLEEMALISTSQDGRRLVIHLAHPLYGEVLRAATPHLQKRRILATLANDLAASGARRRSDRLKLARLAVDGGVTLPSDQLVAAASTAYHNGDLVLAERIGRAAFSGDGTFAAGWDLAYSLYQLGQLEATREHLQRWGPRATTDAERRALAMIQAQLEFWYGGDLATAERITVAAAASFPAGDSGPHGAATPDLMGNLSLFLALNGQFDRALAMATPLLDDGPGTVLIRAALAVAHALGATGHFEQTIAQLDRAVEVFAAIGQEAINLSERVFFAVRSVVNSWMGDLATAERDATRARNESTNEFENAAAHFSSALVPVLRGRPTDAVPFIERAYSWWGPVQAGSTERRWTLARLAWVHAEAGSLERAEAMLRLFDADHSPGILFDYEAALARASLLVARGYPNEARVALREAMHSARSIGYVAGEIHLAYALVRCDRAAEVVERLDELARHTNSRLARAFADHAAGQANDDPAVVLAAATELALIGCMRYATEAAGVATEAAKRKSNQRLARRSALAFAEWSQQCERPGSVAAVAVDAHVPLTRREREIALLAGTGLISREIGERLFISTRTAENHLAKVYEKLGVRSRSELASVLAGDLASASL